MNNKGFTLVELLVSAGIFSMIVVTIVGVFTASIKLQDNILSTKKVIGEINYAMEFMSRNLRMAVKDKDNICLSVPNNNYELLLPTDEGIKFRNVLQSSNCQEIVLDPGTNRIKFNDINTGANSYLTSPSIEVTKLKFYISGDGDDDIQPMVTIYLEAKAGKTPAIKVQTSISQRNLDVYY
jgi:type II secretory pathway pseudopilin PulG